MKNLVAQSSSPHSNMRIAFTAYVSVGILTTNHNVQVLKMKESEEEKRGKKDIVGSVIFALLFAASLLCCFAFLPWLSL